MRPRPTADAAPADPPGGNGAGAGLPVLRRKASLAQTFKAVFWSFFGVRRHADYQQDVAQLNPLHVALAGVVAAAAFVGFLVLVVRWVISSGVAA